MRSVIILLGVWMVSSCDQTNLWQLARQILSVEEHKVDHRSYKVIAVKDGDTIVILQDSTEQIVRLGHVDCPESRQPFGTKAKQFVSDKCFGQYVTLQMDERNKYDRNKRLIAEVYLMDGSNLNKELVRNGLAWHFELYSNDDNYKILEQEARGQRIGIWSEPNPVPPWDWRKGTKGNDGSSPLSSSSV